MVFLSLASVVILIIGVFYAPKSLFKSKSTVVKRLEKFKKYDPILGMIALLLGLVLTGLFVFHMVKEVKWIVVLAVSFCSFILGITLSANNIRNLLHNNILNKFIAVVEDLDKILKQNFSLKSISIFLLILGFIGILSALTFDFK